MTYATRETSLEDAAPIEIYTITRGSYTWTYASANIDIVIGSVTFEASAMKRGSIDQSTQTSRTNLTLTCPASLDFLDQFRGAPPSDITSVVIRSFHLGDDPETDSAVVWMGRISNIKFKDSEAEIFCEPLHASMRRHLLRRKYQRTCPYQLYHPTTCTVDKESHIAISDDTTQTQNIIESSVFAGFADGWFAGGIAEYATETGLAVRFITDHIGNRCYLDLPFLNFIDHSRVRVFPGCDRKLQTCYDKFDNGINYGGQPYYPDKNPMGGTPIF